MNYMVGLLCFLVQKEWLDLDFLMDNRKLGGYTPDWINQTSDFTAQWGTGAKKHWG